MYKTFFKQLLDIVLSLCGIFVLSPVFLIIAVAIIVNDPGPIFFKQKRVGKNKKLFKILKFRSMKMSTPHDTPTHMLRSQDQYITKVGKFLRKTSLDELPQVFNIFVGQMSIIGPRPALWNQYDLVSERDKYGANAIRPGLSGWAQINGRDELEIPVKARLDGEYVDKMSLGMDWKCFWGTAAKVLKQDGIVEGGTRKLNMADKTIKPSLVSIVVPVYNAQQFLDDTIQTVLNQTYNDWELLLINDCSTDKSVEAINKYQKKDRRIKLFSNSKNSGAAISRNIGINEAQGRYVAFLDADDLWEPAKLEKQVAFMREKDCAFSFTGYEFADENGVPNGKKVYIPKTITYKKALKNTTICTITVMFDMHKLTKNDIEMPNVKSEDTATWWKVLKKIDYAQGLNEILSYYRRTATSSSANKITAVRQAWGLYRNVEHLSLMRSSYSFCWYLFNAIRRRV
jgi:O-antigen biosynthesis protein WbqP